jgi:predicted DNA-binding transcriptional regulator YafY
MEISKRTIYRDIDALIARRVPIRGEAGVGFVLEGGFDLPTLMFTADEIAAVVLGAEWVAQHAAPALARAATAVLAKLSRNTR